jgi:hypothetical protein
MTRSWDVAREVGYSIKASLVKSWWPDADEDDCLRRLMMWRDVIVAVYIPETDTFDLLMAKVVRFAPEIQAELIQATEEQRAEYAQLLDLTWKHYCSTQPLPVVPEAN